jgi:NAD(P)-dependent dehydrogenase (short-subunit alcohol dehydrogenase family)
MAAMEPEHSERSGNARVALISGCSSGIGNVTARHLAETGWTVFAGLRRVDTREASTQAAALASAGVRPLPLDVTDQAQLAAAIARISTETGRLDALINNAGVDHLAPLEEDQALRGVMEVNFFGAMALTRLALPLLRRRQGSAIVMLSSLSGLLGLPGSSAYCASKFALEGATEALRNEVGRFGVRVALIEPGGYASAMSAKRMPPSDLERTSPYFPMLEHLASAPAPTADPLGVAALILSVIASGAPLLRYPAGNQALAVATSLATLDDCARQRYARTVTDLEWWNHGKSSPT